MSEKCDGESECTLFGNLNGLLGDPCVKNHKYLEYDYECDFTSENQRSSFCEVNLENRTDSIVTVKVLMSLLKMQVYLLVPGYLNKEKSTQHLLFKIVIWITSTITQILLAFSNDFFSLNFSP